MGKSCDTAMKSKRKAKLSGRVVQYCHGMQHRIKQKHRGGLCSTAMECTRIAGRYKIAWAGCVSQS